MFFDALPPDTSGYMIAGYAVFFIVAAIYLASYFVRARNLSRDLSTLKTLQEEQEAEAAAKKPAPAKHAAKPGRSKTATAKKPQKKAARKR